MQRSLNRYANMYSAARSSRPPKQGERFHMLELGARVTLTHVSRDPRSKEQRLAAINSQFEITGLLPAEGRRFQYRIKDLVTGHERVVLEDQIAKYLADGGEGPLLAMQAE